MVKSREDSVIEIWGENGINGDMERLPDSNPGILRAIISSKS